MAVQHCNSSRLILRLPPFSFFPFSSENLSRAMERKGSESRKGKRIRKKGRKYLKRKTRGGGRPYPIEKRIYGTYRSMKSNQLLLCSAGHLLKFLLACKGTAHCFSFIFCESEIFSPWTKGAENEIEQDGPKEEKSSFGLYGGERRE